MHVPPEQATVSAGMHEPLRRRCTTPRGSRVTIKGVSLAPTAVRRYPGSRRLACVSSPQSIEPMLIFCLFRRPDWLWLTMFTRTLLFTAPITFESDTDPRFSSWRFSKPD